MPPASLSHEPSCEFHRETHRLEEMLLLRFYDRHTDTNNAPDECLDDMLPLGCLAAGHCSSVQAPLKMLLASAAEPGGTTLSTHTSLAVESMMSAWKRQLVYVNQIINHDKFPAVSQCSKTHPYNIEMLNHCWFDGFLMLCARREILTPRVLF